MAVRGCLSGGVYPGRARQATADASLFTLSDGRSRFPAKSDTSTKKGNGRLVLSERNEGPAWAWVADNDQNAIWLINNRYRRHRPNRFRSVSEGIGDLAGGSSLFAHLS